MREAKPRAVGFVGTHKNSGSRLRRSHLTFALVPSLVSQILEQGGERLLAVQSTSPIRLQLLSNIRSQELVVAFDEACSLRALGNCQKKTAWRSTWRPFLAQRKTSKSIPTVSWSLSKFYQEGSSVSWAIWPLPCARFIFRIKIDL